MKDLFDLIKSMKPAVETPFEPTSKWSDVGLDSLDLAELVARVEQTYRIEIENDDWNGLKTLKDLSDYLTQRRPTHA